MYKLTVMCKLYKVKEVGALPYGAEDIRCRCVENEVEDISQSSILYDETNDIMIQTTGEACSKYLLYKVDKKGEIVKLGIYILDKTSKNQYYTWKKSRE